jgi:surfactin synthase thioesterase subunit
MAAAVSDGGTDIAQALVPWNELAEPNAVLVAIPHAAAGAAGFRGWGDELPPVAVYGVRLPGRESRIAEQPWTRMDDVIAELAAAITERRAETPLVLFGQCSGAVTAFELAHSLRRSGQQVSRLYVCGQLPPRAIVEALRATGGDTEQRLRDLGGIPDAVWEEPELLELILPAASADFSVLDGYVYTERPSLECPITALRGEDDEQIGPEAMMGWSEETTGGFDYRAVDGGHLPNPQALVAEIRRDLELRSP